MKVFNIATSCVPSMHYMVDISGKIEKIKKLIDFGNYFTINRARQFGKTTIRYELENSLTEEYIFLNISFEGAGDMMFENESNFSSKIFEMFAESVSFVDENLEKELLEYNKDINTLKDLSKKITSLCKSKDKKIILLIDEVDKSSNNQLFLSFIGMLRDKYISRNAGKDATFWSVILFGVHDVKNLKLKIKPNEEQKYNSPWNVAVDFKVDMTFNPTEISTMLNDYESDYKTGMDIEEMSNLIYDYTNGYPYLVSKLAKLMAEELNNEFTELGLKKAIKILLKEKNTLFDDIIKNLENSKELWNTVYDILVKGKEKAYNVYVYELGIMYGILRESKDGKLIVFNRIFESLIYEYMISKRDEKDGEVLTYDYRTNFVADNGDLKLDVVLQKFQELMYKEYRVSDEKFIEREGRLIFLSFIRPIINGVGFSYVEVETRLDNRMDIVITYNKKQYIIELKIWRGIKEENKGLDQLAKYLDAQNEDKGYLLIFNFNKNKEYKKEWIEFNNKEIYEVIV